MLPNDSIWLEFVQGLWKRFQPANRLFYQRHFDFLNEREARALITYAIQAVALQMIIFLIKLKSAILNQI